MFQTFLAHNTCVQAAFLQICGSPQSINTFGVVIVFFFGLWRTERCSLAWCQCGRSVLLVGVCAIERNKVQRQRWRRLLPVRHGPLPLPPRHWIARDPLMTAKIQDTGSLKKFSVLLNRVLGQNAGLKTKWASVSGPNMEFHWVLHLQVHPWTKTSKILSELHSEAKFWMRFWQ